MTDSEEITWREKVGALARVARYKPKFTAVIVVLGGFVAFLEGVGLSFIWPILEVARSENAITEAEGILGMFLTAYQAVGIPFTLEFLIIGICAVMTVRFTMSFLVAWLKAILQKRYERSAHENL